MKQIVERVRRLCDVVPGDVVLIISATAITAPGISSNPVDMTRLVEVANVLSASISHDIAYFHMPVPVSRTDDDYFRPLAGLNLRGPTEIYLGLVHASDGPDGTRKRIETANGTFRNSAWPANAEWRAPEPRRWSSSS